MTPLRSSRRPRRQALLAGAALGASIILAVAGCSKGGYDGPLQCRTVAEAAAGQASSAPSTPIPTARWAELRHESGVTIPIELDGIGGNYTGTGRQFDKCDPPGFYYIERLAVTDVAGALVATATRTSGTTYRISYTNGSTLTRAVGGQSAITLQASTGLPPGLDALSAGGVTSVPQGGSLAISVQTTAAVDDCGIKDARFWLTPRLSPGTQESSVPGVQAAVINGAGGNAPLRVSPSVTPGDYVVEGVVTSKSGRQLRVQRQNTSDTTYRLVSVSGGSVATSTIPVIAVTVSADAMADREGARIALLEATPAMVSRCDVVAFSLKLLDNKPLAQTQEVALRLRAPTGGDVLTLKLKGTEVFTGTLVVPLDAPAGTWYAYPASLSDDVGNVTGISLSGGTLTQTIPGGAMATTVMVPAATFTVKGFAAADLAGGSPPDLAGPAVDMTVSYPTELNTLSVMPVPAMAGKDSPTVTASWRQGDRLK